MTYLGVIHKGRPQIGGGGGATNADKRGQGGGSLLADILRTSVMDDPL